MNLNRKGIRGPLYLFVSILAVWTCSSYAATPWIGTRLNKYLEKDEAWYKSDEGKAVLEAILSWQDDNGIWPKNVDTTKPYTGDRSKLAGTFDNAATNGEMRMLARAFQVTKEPKYQQAFLKGLDLILKAQYPNGGWPQYYPLRKGYYSRITFNDNAMTRLIYLMQDVSQAPEFDFVDAPRRQAAGKAFEKGIECILKCQVKVNGKLTVWCAQHDENTFEPAPARSYELASLSGGESSEILRLLMRLEEPSPAVVKAVRSGVQWFEASKVEGIRIQMADGRRVAVADPEAPTLWARFYDIPTNRPIFSNRDGVVVYDYNEVDPERTEGYAWYGNWGKEVFEDYEKWKEKHASLLTGEDTDVVVLVGDSTVCDFPDKNDARRGWGEYLPDYFDDSVKVINLARSGRSTKTFLNEGLWEKALQAKPTYILIQFGHNDNHAPDKPESTAADGEYSDNLRRYVDEARAAGAIPILVTPVQRRKFDGSGGLKDTLGPYAEAMKKVAAEKQVGVIDLHKLSGELYLELGEEKCVVLCDDPADRTHFNEKGARMVAEIIAAQLPAAEPTLASLMKGLQSAQKPGS